MAASGLVGAAECEQGQVLIPSLPKLPKSQQAIGSTGPGRDQRACLGDLPAMARVGLPECLIEQEVGIGNDALEPAKASEGIAAPCRQLEPLLPLASLLVVQGRALFRLGLVVILAEQEVDSEIPSFLETQIIPSVRVYKRCCFR